MDATVKGNGPPAIVSPAARLDDGDEGIRTLDLRIANATLSQLSYVPIQSLL